MITRIFLPLSASFSLLLLAQPVLASKPGWSENFADARQRSATENKPLLLDFTGSDWCGYCIRLDREVFAKEPFREFASKALVLLEVDYPRNKTQSAELVRQNAMLDKKFQIEGYPTLILLSPDGKLLKRWDEPPRDLVAELKALTSRK